MNRCTLFLGPVVICALLLGASLLSAGPKVYVKKVGKRLKPPSAGYWYAGEKFGFQTLQGKSWVLVLAELSSHRWDVYQDMLEKIHHPLDKGGPAVLVVIPESNRKVKKIMLDWDGRPDFYLFGDKGNRTFERLSNGVFPYFYVVNPEGIVTWQGAPVEKDFHDVLQSLIKGDVNLDPPGWYKDDDADKKKGKKKRKKGKTKKPNDEKEGSGGKSNGLPRDYRQQVASATKDGKPAECIRLVRLAWKEDRRPNNPVVGPLWDRIEDALIAAVEKAEARLTRGKFSSARKQLLAARKDFEGFPVPAIDKAWAQLAENEARLWFERGKKALESGDTRKGREDLKRILKTYPDCSWAEKAQGLLDG